MGIILDKVSFSYGELSVLHHVSLRVPRGQRVGIVGVSGGGKSTLLKLIAGLYEPDAGKIEVAGVSGSGRIAEVSMVMQNPGLFPFSIRENITCGHAAEEGAIEATLRAAQLTDWIDTLPEGIDTPVGERGGQVSGGQAQRIAVARAMLKDAPVVLLDEATSSLDEDTGAALLRALEHLTRGKTVISVSHCPEALSGFDRVLCLKGGALLDM